MLYLFKAPRQTLTPAQLKTAIEKLGLLVPAQRSLFVAQAMERNPRSDAATYSVDWTGLFEGGDPRERRAFADPVTARRQITADLAARTRSAGRSPARSSRHLPSPRRTAGAPEKSPPS
jgi:hypothetical protein